MTHEELNEFVEKCRREAGWREQPVHVLTCAMPNIDASRIADACRQAKPGGDSIDHGLSLHAELMKRGYAIVKVHKKRCNYQGVPADCNCDFIGEDPTEQPK